MTTRTKDQRDRDREELLEVLRDAGEPLRTDELINRAYGEVPGGRGWAKHYSVAYPDLRALERQGAITWDSHPDSDSRVARWALADPDRDADAEDLADVSRQRARWAEATS